jgi:hypothetical protein
MTVTRVGSECNRFVPDFLDLSETQLHLDVVQVSGTPHEHPVTGAPERLDDKVLLR